MWLIFIITKRIFVLCLVLLFSFSFIGVTVFAQDYEQTDLLSLFSDFWSNLINPNGDNSSLTGFATATNYEYTRTTTTSDRHLSPRCGDCDISDTDEECLTFETTTNFGDICYDRYKESYRESQYNYWTGKYEYVTKYRYKSRRYERNEVQTCGNGVVDTVDGEECDDSECVECVGKETKCVDENSYLSCLNGHWITIKCVPFNEYNYRCEDGRCVVINE